MLWSFSSQLGQLERTFISMDLENSHGQIKIFKKINENEQNYNFASTFIGNNKFD